jgi:hypothetical protein
MIFRLLVFLCLVVPLSAAPTVTVTNPNPGSTVSTLSSISITFSEAVAGVDANDLLINNDGATGLSGSGAGPYVFTFTQPPPGLVSVSWISTTELRAWAPAHSLPYPAGLTR